MELLIALIANAVGFTFAGACEARRHVLLSEPIDSVELTELPYAALVVRTANLSPFFAALYSPGIAVPFLMIVEPVLTTTLTLVESGNPATVISGLV